MKFATFLALFSAIAALCSAIPDHASTIRAPSYPLAVRNPYLNFWLNRNELPGNWPVFWTGRTKGWTGIVRVDNVAYVFMGNPTSLRNFGRQTAAVVTPTQTHFTIQTGPVELNVTFFSPVEVSDPMKQSIPLSYVFVTATPTDGASHVVQVYMDISGEWATSQTTQLIKWSLTTSASGLKVWSTERQTPIFFDEYDEYPTWGQGILSTSGSATHASGSDNYVRTTFVATGFLGNTNDQNFRCAECDWPTFGFAHNLGLISPGAAPQTVQFVVGHVREVAINWLHTPQSALWADYWPSFGQMLDFFWHDVDVALTTADALDVKVLNDAFTAGGQYYADILALSLRQAYGANEFAGNKTHPYLYQKEISSGAFMNTVDVIYPAAPMYHYFDVRYLRYLLEPLFFHMENGVWTEEYSAHDIGDRYPNASGNGYDGPMPIEECGNMLMMVGNIVFHPDTPVQEARDYALAHYPIMSQWANYLYHNCLYPVDQLSTDDFIGHTELNSGLALKGILGMSTFAKISALVGNTTAEAFYNAAVQSFVPIWIDESMHVDGDHMKMEYNVTNGYQFKYNAFHDRLLELNVVPVEIYKMEADFYLTKLEPYGIPFVSRHDYTKSDWEIWTAAAFGDANPLLRSSLIEALGKFLRVTAQRVPFTDWYVTATSNQVGFQARPVAGGHFAILALDTALGKL